MEGQHEPRSDPRPPNPPPPGPRRRPSRNQISYQFSAKLPQKTADLDKALTAFLSQVNATTIQTKKGKDE